MTHARSAIGPTLETERLILRPPASDDFESWAAFHADAEVGEFLGGTLSRAMAWRALCTMAGSWVINGFGMFSAVEKSSGRWVGRIGPWQPEGWPGTEVGWGLAREAWGHGYAVEGATAAVDWAFEVLGWTEVIHAIDPRNRPSQRVAERLGSRLLRSAILPDPLNIPVDIWGQSRDQWLAAPPARLTDLEAGALRGARTRAAQAGRMTSKPSRCAARPSRASDVTNGIDAV